MDFCVFFFQSFFFFENVPQNSKMGVVLESESSSPKGTFRKKVEKEEEEEAEEVQEFRNAARWFVRLFVLVVFS